LQQAVGGVGAANTGAGLDFQGLQIKPLHAKTSGGIPVPLQLVI
jgi:hypothetical protein